MRKDLIEVIEFPEGSAELIDGKIKISGKEGAIMERIIPGLFPKIDGKKITIEVKKSTKNEKKLLKSFAAHIKKAIKGVNKKYIYKMQICFVHFPVTVTYDSSKRELTIKNFLGETKPRVARILPNVDLKIEGDKIILESIDKDAVGQSAANIEITTKIRSRDRRIFQDGIWITEKDGKSI